MDASSMKDLRAVTRKVLKQVEDLSGKGIEFMREDAYFSDRSRPFQTDRSRRFSVIVVDSRARE
jgi:hypothetical protein